MSTNETLAVAFVGRRHGAVLTTDHAASSYGQPVLVVDGVAYSPADPVPAQYMAETGMSPTVWGNIHLCPEDLVYPLHPLHQAWVTACSRVPECHDL